MTTFRAANVDRGTKRFTLTAIENAVLKRIRVKCEATFISPRAIVDISGNENRFLAAVHAAYTQHCPLVFSPDAIWMCIVQGFAQHVNLHAENLRHLFVEHEVGKKKLSVRRDDFVKGSSSNPWPEVFDDFSAQIKKAVGDKVYGVLTPSFTTTGPVERAAAQLVIMDAFKEYFDYSVCTLCGIPEITLEGTVEDWAALREKAMALKDFDLSWWTDEFSPVLEQFVEAAAGRIDQKFWSSIYKLDDMSGGPYITGWIMALYPYATNDGRLLKNPYMALWRSDSLKAFDGMTTDSFPPGLCSTPFMWNYLGAEYSMNFYSGFMAISQDPSTLALRPEIGWAVADGISERVALKGSK